MSMAEQLSENSRQGFAAQKPPRIGLESNLSPNRHWGCSHVYDETPVGLAVYVRNNPVNMIDPDGRMTSEIQYAMMMGMALPFVTGISGSQNFADTAYSGYMQSQAIFNNEQYFAYCLNHDPVALAAFVGDTYAMAAAAAMNSAAALPKGTVTVIQGRIIIDPNEGMTSCTGPAKASAVGPNQARYTGTSGALYSAYDNYSIPGGIPRTVAVQSGFLGLDRQKLRQYGTQIYISFSDNGAIANSGGPLGPYTVSDLGDVNIQNDPAVRFDVYRWNTQENGMQFGIRSYRGTVTFPTASGGKCPPGWSVVP